MTENMISMLHLVRIINILLGEYVVDEPTTIVETQCGPVEGKYNGQGYAFRGIPYSLPPTGNRRWKPPIPLNKQAGNCWDGIFKAYDYGNTCTQRNMKNHTDIIGSEDCLYLNVWTPTINKSANLHVMVWIHGGSLQELNANWPTYCPSEELARDTNIVYVGMNYRLNAFGFMSLSLLSEQSKTNTSGNYGFMDQILALRWVQDNVRNFGGNPDSVTIFGQSSGGTSIVALLASEQARGLFHKAWMMSASPIFNKTSHDASQDNLVFLENTGCTDIHCLYNLSGTEITKAVPWDVYPSWGMTDQCDLPIKGQFDGAVAVVDGDVVTYPPYQAWEQGLAIDVPLVIGTTTNEIDFYPSLLTMSTWDWSEYKKQVSHHLTTFGANLDEEALRFYPINASSPEYEYTSMASDIRVGCPTDYMARVISTGMNSPVFRYVVTSQPSKPVHALGYSFPSSYSFHLWDIFAYFDTIKDYIKPPASSDRSFQETIRREILSFVRTGAPFTKSWQPYSHGVTSLLSENISVVSNYKKETCKFWSQNGLFSYGWIN
ncbi:para-nitrobenzyl esterase-like [Ylistrum balloti]|uniref:para-nitrobenzyl esterase-like n=1 Tax=Ylistrum balloti TaxID=509963 RepID=UPI002905CFC6|nr:para-nitrobenzyl esterase-like [Ylistrum balloti]